MIQILPPPTIASHGRVSIIVVTDHIVLGLPVLYTTSTFPGAAVAFGAAVKAVLMSSVIKPTVEIFGLSARTVVPTLSR